LIKVEKVKKKKDPTKEETVCLANGLEVSKFENFKKSSQFLKEPLATELVNESDHFTNDAVQLLKFHGSYQQDNRENRRPGKSKDRQMMLRLRNPGGEVPGKLFLALDELSENLVKRFRLIITTELVGFATIPLFATLMARGVGLG